MKKWVVDYYNRYGCADVKFYVIAKDEKEAEELFLLKNKGHHNEASINSIYEYSNFEPDFEDIESILKEI